MKFSNWQTDSIGIYKNNEDKICVISIDHTFKLNTIKNIIKNYKYDGDDCFIIRTYKPLESKGGLFLNNTKYSSIEEAKAIVDKFLDKLIKLKAFL